MTKIKICGITNLPDARAAIQAGADYLGFNFYPKSPRYIAPAACAEITSIVKRAHPHIKLVGVFVNAPVDEIIAILDACSLDLAQLHGDEPPEALAALGGKAFKALRISAQSAYPLPHPLPQPALLIDAAVKGVYGGSGVTADWNAAAEIARRYSIFLAGGLTAENVSAAIRQVHPWGVDVASGVESAPGVKDAARMKAFVNAVKLAKYTAKRGANL